MRLFCLKGSTNLKTDVILYITRVCCRSPIIPARPSYSAELMSLSYSGSLPRSSGTSGSAPDLSSAPEGGAPSTPVTDIWRNPLAQQSSTTASQQQPAGTTANSPAAVSSMPHRTSLTVVQGVH